MRFLLGLVFVLISWRAEANVDCERTEVLNEMTWCANQALQQAKKEYGYRTRVLNSSSIYSEKEKQEIDDLYSKNMALFERICRQRNQGGRESPLWQASCLMGHYDLMAQSKKNLVCDFDPGQKDCE